MFTVLIGLQNYQVRDHAHYHYNLIYSDHHDNYDAGDDDTYYYYYLIGLQNYQQKTKKLFVWSMLGLSLIHI